MLARMAKHATHEGSHASLAEEVHRQLLDDISGGRWTGEETVSAYALSRRLGVSRTPAVEALKRLEAEGLIEILPRVGARLTRSTPDARDELFSIVSALLGLAAERAAQRVDEAWLESQDELVAALARSAERRDVPEFRRLVGEFHRNLIRIGLPVHAQVVERVWWLMRAEALRDMPTVIRPSAVSELRWIVNAMRSHSRVRARAAVERQFAGVVADIQRESKATLQGAPDHEIGLEHAALLYRTQPEFIASAVPFVLGGLQQDESVLVVSTEENMDALGSALGADGVKLDYRQSAAWYDDPSSALRRYRQYIDEQPTGSRVRIIGEPVWTDRREAAVEDWLRYESVINVALESAPASIVCPYDVGKLPSDIVDGARTAHPDLYQVDGLTASPEYRHLFTLA